MADTGDNNPGPEPNQSSSSGSPDPSVRVSSPAVPLAPLKYLQNQRRGSITDPSLHAAGQNQLGLKSHFIQPSEGASGKNSPDHRPPSPYVFGNATLNSSESNPQLRRLLRSPSLEHMNISRRDGSPVLQGALKKGTSQFDYTMRRHSIATDPHSRIQLPSTHGTKRKMSSSDFPRAVGEESDSRLGGPGVPMEIEEDSARAPKRRGSAIDTHRISQLSLNDRRNSVDSRGSWWMNERRDSTSSMFSTHSSYSSAFSGKDSPQGGPPGGIGSFAWPSTLHPSESPSMQSQLDPNSRVFDSSMTIMPGITFNPDRRMSIPDPLSGPGPTRRLRSRSRPASRERRGGDHSNSHSGPSSGQEDPISTPSPSNSSKQPKESSTTPYSRSPELRVSHKLAERKRRKEMKELFDELRDHLPADRGMKASKWEILSKAIDFVGQLKQNHQEMAREIEMLRHELDLARQGGFTRAPHIVYSQGPPITTGQYPSGGIQPSAPHSRPSSSQNTFPPTGQNGSMSRPDGSLD
ncbi:hypothetical protein C8J56DRAFT_858405 [Mycena floridula]|nr:hypothetical protein C8J56DRAFT_858405 [Mycena floridula]